MGAGVTDGCGAASTGITGAFLDAAGLVAALLAGSLFLAAGLFFGEGVVMPGIFISCMCTEGCATAVAGNDKSATVLNAAARFNLKMNSIAWLTQPSAPR